MSQVITKHGSIVDSNWLARQRGWRQTPSGRWLKVSPNGRGVTSAESSYEAIARELPDVKPMDKRQ